MITLTNSIRKTVSSLDKAKCRKESGLFMAEGTKCVLDTLPSFTLRWLFATAGWLADHPEAESAYADRLCVTPAGEMKRLSQLSTPPEVIAVYETPSHAFSTSDLTPGLYIALDTVQDPGNLGTIMRTADWMGVTTIFCSPGCADAYSPKVVQSTMGAIARVKVVYLPLEDLIARFPYPVYGTFLDGDNIYSSPLSSSGLLVMGNEGKGISPAIDAMIKSRLRIPSYPPMRLTSESLNVAVATAICLAEFRRRQS